MEVAIYDRDLKILKSLTLNGELSKKISNAAAVITHSQGKNYVTSKFCFDLDGEQLGTLVDALGGLLVETGVDEDGEISVVGREIESLIDVLLSAG